MVAQLDFLVPCVSSYGVLLGCFTVGVPYCCPHRNRVVFWPTLTVRLVRLRRRVVRPVQLGLARRRVCVVRLRQQPCRVDLTAEQQRDGNHSHLHLSSVPAHGTKPGWQQPSRLDPKHPDFGSFGVVESGRQHQRDPSRVTTAWLHCAAVCAFQNMQTSCFCIYRIDCGLACDASLVHRTCGIAVLDRCFAGLST